MRILWNSIWRRKTALRCCAFTLWTISAASAAPVATTPQRVVSANLCADQLVLALADPVQIVSLGPFARDSSLSYLSDQANAFPSSRGSLEEIIDLKADFVLLGSFDSRYARAALDRRKISYMLLEPWNNLEQGRQQIQDVASSLGHRERGDALIAQIDAGIMRLQRQAALLPAKVNALVLHRRGYAMHSGVTAELAGLAGFGNAAAALGMTSSGLIPMERVVARPPDYLIVARNVQQPSDQGESVLVHPALMRLFPAEKRLVIPDRLSICAGPSTPALIDRLIAETAKTMR